MMLKYKYDTQKICAYTQLQKFNSCQYYCKAIIIIIMMVQCTCKIIVLLVTNNDEF